MLWCQRLTQAPNVSSRNRSSCLQVSSHWCALQWTVCVRSNSQCYDLDKTPLELGTVPWRRKSYSVACRSALANALKDASIIWCEFFPASWRMWRVIPDVFTTDWKKCSTSCVSYVPTLWVGISKPQLKWGRPDRSSITSTAASSSGAVKCPKRLIPFRSPSASSSAYTDNKKKSSHWLSAYLC